MRFTDKLIMWPATGFGLGLSPFASGTTGSLPGVLIVMAMAGLSGPWAVTVALLLALAAIPVCDRAEKILGRKDDGRIVADEYLTFPLCTLGLPWTAYPWLLVMAFVVNRVLDIVKPPPARQIQDLPGGYGIVLDDVVSSLYALGVNHVLFWCARRFLLAG